ncbi:MAG: Omp28-related outer membrane protein [Muribaculaceae bacterium]|nr:Omp28-related outer membrane protein [Muribaculaceae bacterium]
MKKILLLLTAALLLPLAVEAQSAMPRPDVRKCPLVVHAPAKMDLQENQRIMGHYDNDVVGTEGVGLTTTTGKVSIGTILESEELDIFNGGKIVSFRVGLAESTPVTKVFVVPITSGGAYGSMVSWPCEVSATGWNVINLTSPYQLNLSEGGRLLIGFEYEQTQTNKPLALVNEGDEAYDTYWYKKAGHQYRWTTAGLKSYGNLCIQCVVEKDHFPEVLIKTGNLQCPGFVKKGDEMPFSFTVKNRGTQALNPNDLTFDVNIDGEKVATISNPEVLESGITTTIEGIIETSELTSGSHTLTINNAVALGETLDYVYPMNAEFMIHSGTYPRQKHYVEQYTSTYCTYCPLGNSMLSILKQMRDDIIWVGVHANFNGVDPMSCAQGDSIMDYVGNNSYPSATFDRSTGWENERQLVNSIGYYADYHQQIAEELGHFFDYITEQNPTFASIEISPVVDPETREAVIIVSGEMTPDFDLLLGDDNVLNVFITEDSVVAPQLNSGMWVSQYVHNGVFRCALGSVKGVGFNRVDGGYSNEFTVTIPEEWVLDNLNVVAFISRPIAAGVLTDMELNNAESVRLYNPSHSIEEILADGDAVPVEYYDIMGHRTNGPRQGINIVKMSDGTARKVLVK